ncbi:enoyl-CoA hydratase [Rhodosalinus halophilus]|uniref:Enoyl-CoA hydratase n=2 Tax=Rhodosalinus TaxID=2047740 RepID=A0A365UBJ7_9RHOB|nr:3-hydroxyacyl-CoA dehydrogenase NAD-binding domain-containing protein [Rhodosalinus halophilus]RBI86652.1 enoyl-CoA hydratase [Rhodosalinus halophilus]
MTKATLIREGTLGVLRIDNPPVNAISPEVTRDLDAALDVFEAAGDLEALVIECAGRTFVAGGDIASFSQPGFSAAPFNAVLRRIEDQDRPVAAALFGTVLGAGLELAMAAHIRVAHPATRLGLPEITLGLIPGSLGTQRLPRLAGLATAWRMISTGKPVDAQAALDAGIVDTLDDDPAGAARAAARAGASRPVRRTRDLTVPAGEDDTAVLAAAREEAAAKPHLPALTAAADCLAAAAEKPFDAGERVEADHFARLLHTPASRALRHIFFAERAAAKIPGLPPDLERREVRSLGIVGVGTMGAGIALTFARAGFPVTLIESDTEALERGRGHIRRTLETSVQRGRMTEDEAEAQLARMSGATDMGALSEADMVIEAVFEDMSLKLDVAAKLGEAMKPGAIIATNTSTLDVDRIAEATGRPGDVLGTHFFSPAHIMKLLEVVRGRLTEPEVLATVMSLARRIGKVPVVSGVCYGFIGNRMAEVYMRESEAMQLEGATPAQIDGVAEDPAWIGMAMGPSRMLDMAGVDVGARTVIEWVESGEGPQDPAYRALCRALFEAGRHGQKTGAGYYAYEGRRPVPSEETAGLAAELAEKHGVARREAIPGQEVFERLLYPMVNEAARILEEGIAYRPGDIDVVWTQGYGFPAWRGGPVFMADEIGLPEIVARLDHYAATLGNDRGYWDVAPLLRELARRDARLSDWRPQD